MRILENRTEMSYLDYFITANIDDPKLEIMSQIGQSDHFPVQLKFEKAQIGEIYIRKEFTYQFGRVRSNAMEIMKTLKETLSQGNKVKALVGMIRELRRKYKPKLRKAGNSHLFIDKLKNIQD